jgi:ferric-dicitrate binding protein FerR (iron transport regulator)
MSEENDTRYAEGAARLLRAGRATVGPRADARPEAVIAALADAIRGSARRRKVRAWVIGGAAAIASAAAAAVLSLGTHHRASDIAARAPAPAAPARPAAFLGFTAAGAGPVTAGETLATLADPLELTAADGTSVRVDPRSEVTLVRADAIRWLQLQSGSLEAHVTKLAPGARFVIATPDRQVEVHGTRFRVSLAPADAGCGGGTVTRVQVEEGVVTVRPSGGPEERIAAGGAWPAGCAPRAPELPARLAARPARRSRHHASAAPAEALVPETTPSSSTLGAENDLFAAAARADRAGDSAAALRALDELVTRYPASPLRGPAESARARILSRAPSPAPSPAPAP